MSIIVPACRADTNFERVLDGVDTLDPAPGAVVLADDGSPGAAVSAAAEARGWRAVRVGDTPAGPAAARNAAAATLAVDAGHWLFFVDADVVPHPDAVAALRRSIASPAAPAAVLGSYDARPPARNPASRYANLRHHHVHHVNAGRATTFWAGLGAVRSDVFAEVGGFDARRYPRPSIEDIELGMRIHAAGHVLIIDPRVLGTHLKRWTVKSLWRTEIRDRAWAWSRLIHATPPSDRPLNLRDNAALKAAVAGVVVACAAVLAATFGFALFVPGLLPLVLIAAMALTVNAGLLLHLERRLFVTLSRHTPRWQWPLLFALHALHLTYSAATYAVAALVPRSRGAGR